MGSTLACSPPSQDASGGTPSEPAIATVSGEAISSFDLRFPPDASAEVRKRALEGAILRHLAAAEARRRGLADQPDVAAKLLRIEREAKARREAVLRDALHSTLRDEIAPSEEELRVHYQATRIRYAERQLRVMREPFPSREAAGRALAQGKRPAEVAESFGPAPVARLPRSVLPEALRLERAGARAVAGSDEEGWSLIELAELLPVEPRPFEEVRAEVERSLRAVEAENAMRALLRELREAAAIEIDEAALAKVVPAGEAPWDRHVDR